MRQVDGALSPKASRRASATSRVMVMWRQFGRACTAGVVRQTIANLLELMPQLAHDLKQQRRHCSTHVHGYVTERRSGHHEKPLMALLVRRQMRVTPAVNYRSPCGTSGVRGTTIDIHLPVSPCETQCTTHRFRG